MKDEVLQKAESFISNLFETNLSPKNYYHNFDHTKRVVTMVSDLSKNEDCNSDEISLLQLAAWFHDSGYVKMDEGHEKASVQIFHDFISEEKLTAAEVSTVKDLISVTKMGIEPKTHLEKIMKDADCAHLGAEDFFEVSESLRVELELKSNTTITKPEWLLKNKEFLTSHKFHTKTAKAKWTPSKEINIFKLDKKIKKTNKAKKPKRQFGKGVETMFRVTLKNHIELSAIADTKANILLSVNAIIISVALSSLVPKLDNASNFFLVYPTLVLTFFSVFSIILSVLSTRPNISNVNVTREMIQNNNTNILFFGNFYKMSLKDFEWGIDYLMDNEETLYNSMTKDLYFLGLVLKRKYKLLRITYTVFMIGIIASVLSFVLSYYFIIYTK